MPSVLGKSKETRAIHAVHRARTLTVFDTTALVNHVRGQWGKSGIVAGHCVLIAENGTDTRQQPILAREANGELRNRLRMGYEPFCLRPQNICKA